MIKTPVQRHQTVNRVVRQPDTNERRDGRPKTY